MVDRANLRTALHISLAEFRRWFRSSRLIILCVMLVFVHRLIITTLEGCVRMMGEPVAAIEAFLALGNSGMVVVIVPVLFLTMMADFPQKAGIDYFYQIRCEKKVWICGQILFALEASAFLVLFLMASSMLMIAGNAQWKMEFSHAVTYYASTFPGHEGDYIVKLFPANLYHQMTFGGAVWHTVSMMFLYYLLLALILLLSALCNKKFAGVLADGFLIILGGVTCATRISLMWLFPMAHTIGWLHYEAYLNEQVFPIKGSYIYMLGCCIVLAVCCMAAARGYRAGEE